MMKKIPRILILLIVSVLYSVGNNQIARAETTGSMVSQSSITFDKTYIPQPSNPIIPDGREIVLTNHGTNLPRTGSKTSFNCELGGFFLLITSLIVKKIKILGE